jgi:hypothetical protein
MYNYKLEKWIIALMSGANIYTDSGSIITYNSASNYALYTWFNLSNLNTNNVNKKKKE